MSPIHKNDERDHEEGECIKQNPENKRSNIKLLGAIRILIGLFILLLHLKLIGSPSEIKRNTSKQRATATEDAQPRPKDRIGHITTSAAATQKVHKTLHCVLRPRVRIERRAERRAQNN